MKHTDVCKFDNKRSQWRSMAKCNQYHEHKHTYAHSHWMNG